MTPAQSAQATPHHSRPQSPQLSPSAASQSQAQSQAQSQLSLQSQLPPQSPLLPPTDNAESTAIFPMLKDLAIAFKLAVFTEWRRFVRCFIQVPVGIVAIMASCFGIDRLLNMGGVSFPASVACLVILFVALVLCDLVLGRRPTEKIVRAINIPGGWSLRWMNLFFVQSFVMLPLSPHISIVEIIKLILVFVIGFLLMMVVSVYMTRWIQMWTSPPRKAMLQRSEQVASESESEELTPLRASTFFSDDHNDKDMPPIPPRSRVAAYITVRGQNLDDPLSSFSDVPAPNLHFYSSSSSYSTPRHYYRPGGGTRTPTPPPRESPPPIVRAPRADRWAEWASGHIDTCFYFTVMLAVGVPVYYSTGYAMPLQLSINILAFFAAMSLPASWRQILHPVIVSAFSSLLIIWLLGRVRGDSLTTTLGLYKPGHTYIKLWTNAATHPHTRMLPGAGDILSSFLDASIVSLALPMFQYRYELKTHFSAIVVPNIVLSIVSLFAYPIVCRSIGISATRGLAFTSRSLTLALATPAVTNLGGDLNTIAAITILSGVFGVLIGQRMLRMLRIPEDDYVTRGVSIGANASALGTALLLRVDPRAAAISSLAMSLFGTITVAFSSIPPIVNVIRATVGL